MDDGILEGSEELSDEEEEFGDWNTERKRDRCQTE